MTEELCNKQSPTRFAGAPFTQGGLFSENFQKSIDFCGYVTYNEFVPTIKEVHTLGNKKIGRPTESPKNTTIKFRIDSETLNKLNDCSKKLGVTKSEVLRRGVHRIHEDLKK